MEKTTGQVENIIENKPEESTNQVTVVNSDQLINDKAKELTNAIATAQTKDELEALYQKFFINNTKKNAMRITQLNDLLDQINKQAVERFTKRPYEISNKEILDYMTAVQNQIERSQKTVEGIKDINAIQINNTQNNTVNIHVGGEDTTTSLSKDARDRIAGVIASILKENRNDNIPEEPQEQISQEIQEMPIDVEVIEKEEVNPQDDEFIGDE